MTATETQALRAGTYDEIRPLVELCKAGKLFEVQKWVAAGEPVNPPPIPAKGQRRKSPLDVAIARGFHSLIQVLLEAGAVQEPLGWNSPMSRALEMRRFDIVRLLVENGFDPRKVNMAEVFDSWDPDIMEYFIDRGADVETGNPLAYAFCNRIRTALRIYKRYRDRFASFQEQANIALRYHCKEGNMKWVSLMLWAGADPYAAGTESYEEEVEPDEEGISALEFAALYGNFKVFGLKQVRLDPGRPAMTSVLRYAYKAEGEKVALKLLKLGMNPNDQENGGCSAIQRLLNSLGWTAHFNYFTHDFDRKNLDTEESRAKIKAIHLLAKNGAKWVPKDSAEINDARRSLLKLTDEYTVEFVWIMSKYSACSHEHIEQLLRTPTIKRHMADYRARLRELIATWA